MNTKLNTRKNSKLDFREAAALLYKMGVVTSYQFEIFKKEGLRPPFIPSSPKSFYSEYKSWSQFIESGKRYLDKPIYIVKTISYQDLKYLNRRLSISTRKAYYEAFEKNAFQVTAPKHPDQYYSQDWEGWDDFLAPNHAYVSFQEARRFARTLGLKSSSEWRKYCREGAKPSYIPTVPDRDYDEFSSWIDFLTPTA